MAPPSTLVPPVVSINEAVEVTLALTKLLKVPPAVVILVLAKSTIPSVL